MAESLYHKTPITILDKSNPVSKEISGLASSICGANENTQWFENLIPLRNLIQKEKVNRNLLREKFYA